MKPDRFISIAVAAVICLPGASLGAGSGGNSFRAPVVKTPSATTYSAKPTSTKVNKGTTPKIKFDVGGDEGPVDSPVLASPRVIPLDEILDDLPEEGESDPSVPRHSTAEIKNDPAFRLLVTIHGTVFAREARDLFRVQKGSVLMVPNHKMVVVTPACTILLHRGSVVSIDVTKTTTAVRDFHDRWRDHVVVKTDTDPKMSLMPGIEVVVSHEDDEKMAWQQAIHHRIYRRQFNRLVSDKHHTIFKGEFSIPDAMLKSNHFLLLKQLDDKEAKDVIDEVMKTAALLHGSNSPESFSVLR